MNREQLYNEFCYWSKKYLYLIPPIHIIFTLYVTLVDFDFWGYIRLGNSTGYSLLTSFVYIVVFNLKTKYCLFTKLSTIGLFSIALLNYIGSIYFTSTADFLYYENCHSKIVVTLVFLLTALLILIKKNK